MSSRRQLLRVSVTAFLLAYPAASLLSAATIDWVGHGVGLKHTYDGNFSAAINWSTGAVPGSSDDADFNANATYTVTFTNSPVNLGLLVPAGNVTFATSIIPSYLVGSANISGQLTLDKVNLLSTGDVTINGSDALVGPTNASLTVDAATQLTSGSISLGASSILRPTSGTLTVTGAGALVTQLGSSNLTVGTAAPFLGSAGTGLLHVDSGGAFTTGNGSIQVNQLGTINLTGGTFNAQGNMAIMGGVLESDASGNFSLGAGRSLTVQAGGRVDLGMSAPLPLAGSTVTVDGAASFFNTAAGVEVGSGGLSSTMTWQNRATGTVGGLLVGAVDPSSKGTVIIQSAASVSSTKTDIGAANQSGQSGTVTISGGGALTAGQLAVGAANSSGTINVTGGVLMTPDAADIGPMGKISVASSSLFEAHGNVNVAGGSLQTDASSTFWILPGNTLFAAGKVDLNGTVAASGATLIADGAGNHLNIAQVPQIDFSTMTGTITYQNGATGALPAGLQLGATTADSSHVVAAVLSGAQISAGGIAIGTGGQTGQTGQFTVSGSGSSVAQSILNTNLMIGANANSTGLLHIDSGGTFSAGASTTVNPTGTINVTGGTFGGNGVTVSGGSVQSDAAGVFSVGSLIVQKGGRADFSGAFDSPVQTTVSDAASHLNLAQPLTLGRSVSGFVMFSSGATGNLAGGLNLDESSNSNGSALIQSGAQVTAGNIDVGADGNSTNSMPSLTIQGAGSSLTQTGAATLNVGAFGAGMFSVGSMKVQNGGTFTSGTGPTLVSVNSTVEVLGGTYNANGDMTVSAATLTLDAASHFALAPGKTITFMNDAMVTLKGPFTGGNVDNEVSLNVNSPAMAVQAFDGGGDLTVAAGAHLTADHVRQASLTLNGNAAIRPEPSANSDASASSLDRLTIMGAGQLDLANNRLAINYPAGQSPIATIRSYLTTGYNNGAWNGPGIVTSSGDATHALGYADSADGIVKNLPANTELVEFARVGDTNLEGQVGFDDLVTVARHYNQSNANWDQGDFNYDGKVGFDDLVAVARNYGKTVTAAQLAAFDPSIQADIESAFAQVPEPSATVAMVAAAIVALFRGRARL